MDNNNHPRKQIIEQIIESLLDKVFKNIQNQEPSLTKGGFTTNWISFDHNNLDIAIQEYWGELPRWKKYFNTNIIDHHKVAALTAYYYLKNKPVKILDKTETIGVVNLFLEISAFHIAVSNLIYMPDRFYNLKDRHAASVLNSFRNIDFAADPRQLITNISLHLYHMEQLHLNDCLTPR
jgi:hypothetical protein